MIKPDDIKKHTAEFFTSDPDFVLWCLDPERAQDGYWCGYTERHPQDLLDVLSDIFRIAYVRGPDGSVAVRPAPDDCADAVYR